MKQAVCMRFVSSAFGLVVLGTAACSPSTGESNSNGGGGGLGGSCSSLSFILGCDTVDQGVVDTCTNYYLTVSGPEFQEEFQQICAAGGGTVLSGTCPATNSAGDTSFGACADTASAGGEGEYAITVEYSNPYSTAAEWASACASSGGVYAAPGEAYSCSSSGISASGVGSDGGSGVGSDGGASGSGSSSSASRSGTVAARDGGTDASVAAMCEGNGDGATGVGTSCATSGPGLTNCGDSCSDNCCTSLEVPGGTYSRTYDEGDGIVADDGGPTGLADPATVSGFRLDKYLVTVGRFRQFVNAWNGGYLPPDGSGKHTHLNGGSGLVNSATEVADGAADGYETGWDATDWNNTTDVDPTDANLTTNCQSATYATWTSTAGTQENLPINCITWYEAYAFCIWDGGFLPSEAEWEYAAAGGSEQLEYPWGSTAPGTACPGAGCDYAIYGCDYPSGSGTCTGVANVAPVGAAPLGVGLWGQLDWGNMFEWNLDWHSSYVDPCTDCAYLTAATYRALRGGNFSNAESYLLPSDRTGGNGPTVRGNNYGLRCARTP